MKAYIKQFNILWHINYWDGPLSGIVEWRSKKYYFALAKGRDDKRIFGMYKLTTEETAEFSQQHKEFEDMVGTHTNYKNNRRDPDGKVKPNLRGSGYYEKYQPSDYYAKKDLGSKIEASRHPIAKFIY